MTEFSKDGRKLRPRRSASAQGKPAYSTTGGRNYGEHRNYSAGAGREEGGRSYGSNRSYGRDGERRSSGKAYGERRGTAVQPSREGGYGDRRTTSNGFESRGTGKTYSKPYGDRKQYGERKQYGTRKPYGSKPAYGAKRSNNNFNKTSDEGINRMIAASPKAQISDFDSAPSMVKEEIRLNKFIANSGVCSRREADTMIQAGVVTVNGEVVTELGTKVNVLTDVVKFNGETLRGEAKVYIVMNKPKGYVTTASDPHADKTVMDLLKNCPNRVYPVGRLDKATTGVLMFTNDGEISERLTHPSYDKKKIYQVVLNKPLTEEDRQKILTGIELNDGVIAADALEFIDPEDKRKLGIEIHSGKNRIVRRIFEAVGCEVRTLDRVYFAGLTKKGLKKGEWRYLTEGEVNILKMGAYV